MTTPKHSWLFYYFLAVLAWAPLPLGSNREWSTTLLAYLLLAGLASGILLLAAGRIQISTACRQAWPALLTLLLTQAWVAMQLLFDISVAPQATQQALLLGSALTSAFALVLLLVDSLDRALVLARFMVACGVFQALFAACMMLGRVEELSFMDKIFNPATATGTFVNRNHLAGFLAMNLALGTGLVYAQLRETAPRGWHAWLRHGVDTLLSSKFRLRLLLVIMVVGLVLTRSRMGNIAFFSSLLIAGAAMMLVQRRVTYAAAVFFASVLIIDLLLVGHWFGVEQLVERLQTASLATDHRDEVARDSLVMWRDYFWQGTGADTFAYAYIQGGYMSPDSLSYRHAHNDYLEIGTGFGFIGFSLLAIAVTTSLLRALKAMRPERSPWTRGLGLGCLMGIVSILLHSFTDFNLHIPVNSLWFVVLLGLSWAAAAPHTASADLP
ncbi:MAG: O-antigen ligase family protein [Pseudomonadota bacterium]